MGQDETSTRLSDFPENQLWVGSSDWWRLSEARPTPADRAMADVV